MSVVDGCQIASAILFVVTALLLMLAQRENRELISRGAVYLSFLTVIGAIRFMLAAYAGEKTLTFDPVALAADKVQKIVVPQRSADVTLEIVAGRKSDAVAGAVHGDGSAAGSAISAFGAQTDDGRPFRDCPECPEMVTIPAGYFMMGAADPASPGVRPQELPRRQVRIPRRLAIGRHEVTVGEYAAFVAATGRTMPACTAEAAARGPRHPIACVSHGDASEYAAWLSLRTGEAYRLPSAAEWEYAARGGSAGNLASGILLEQARLAGSQGPRTVGASQPNAFGLHDVHGNVAELVADCWTATLAAVPTDGSPAEAGGGPCAKRMVKDAFWSEGAERATVSARRSIDPAARNAGVGFRVARDIRFRTAGR